ncbi:MAG: tRNA (adenine-N1)-methyltransferase [Thermosediminibacteraceae bacterium]|nr:tRNA (adenine-N1)-methyltransferase [Thermosediminibacteraceae bacterium]
MRSGFETKRVIIGPDGFKKVVDIASPNKIGLPNGQIDSTQLAEIKPGNSFAVNGVDYYVLNCDMFDYVMYYLKRRTQIVYPKEGAYILMRLDVSPGKRVGEAGTGSGAFTVCLSRAVGPEGRVYTYEQREEFYKLAEKNIRGFSEFNNVVMHHKSINEGIEERDLDAFFLDVREPWEVLAEVRKALKPAGHLGILVPTTNQVAETMTSLEKNGFYISEVVEIMMRKYKLVPERLRPEDLMIGHTGYLIFARKLGE